jgi:excisionase family DNA binding protein
MENAEKLLTVREFAKLVRLSEITVYRRVEDGSFPSIKCGGRRLVPAAFLDNLIDTALTSR